MATAKEKASAPVEEVVAVGVGNCSGELVQLPDVEGTTYHEYKCQVCGQIVHVGHEDLEANGLPPEHARLETD